MSRPSKLKREREREKISTIEKHRLSINDIKLSYMCTTKRIEWNNQVSYIPDRSIDPSYSGNNRGSFSGPSHQKISNFVARQECIEVDDMTDYYKIIHMSCLMNWWNKLFVPIATRCGMVLFLFERDQDQHIETMFERCTTRYKCSQCHCWSVFPTGARIDHLIVKIGANLAGIGHPDLTKLCASMNLQPPIDEDHFRRTITEILPSFEFQRKSMSVFDCFSAPIIYRRFLSSKNQTSLPSKTLHCFLQKSVKNIFDRPRPLG